jgi:hypothetical protein
LKRKKVFKPLNLSLKVLGRFARLIRGLTGLELQRFRKNRLRIIGNWGKLIRKAQNGEKFVPKNSREMSLKNCATWGKLARRYLIKDN